MAAGEDAIGRRRLETGAVAAVNDAPTPFADGARSYALHADAARRLWARSEQLVGAAQDRA